MGLRFERKIIKVMNRTGKASYWFVLSAEEMKKNCKYFKPLADFKARAVRLTRKGYIYGGTGGGIFTIWFGKGQWKIMEGGEYDELTKLYNSPGTYLQDSEGKENTWTHSTQG